MVFNGWYVRYDILKVARALKAMMAFFKWILLMHIQDFLILKNIPNNNHEMEDYCSYCSHKGDESDSESESIPEDEEPSYREIIASWALLHNVPHSTIERLLDGLRPLIPDLPKTPRTLIATPTDIYCYLGIEKGIHNAAANKLHKLIQHQSLTLHVNVDGMSPFRSSPLQIWPITGLIKELPGNRPFLIGIFCGKSKPPSLSEYLSDFVTEMRALKEKGLEIHGHQLELSLDAFICDAPARAYIFCLFNVRPTRKSYLPRRCLTPPLRDLVFTGA